jgi:hypothetical protein
MEEPSREELDLLGLLQQASRGENEVKGQLSLPYHVCGLCVCIIALPTYMVHGGGSWPSRRSSLGLLGDDRAHHGTDLIS